jgi:ribA/ribD-fused uncharacterized protein
VTTDATAARTVGGLVAAIESGIQPRYVLFWGHTPKGGGELDAACLSQWWPAVFDADGQRFASAEHYMMWRKAKLFNDEATAAAVLTVGSPAKAKALGRTVTGFDDGVWQRHRWDIVVAGSVAKFGSDPALRSFLLATRRRVLVEASPLDRIWGIGLAADSEHATNPSEWRGLYLLGFALMEAREQLA